MVAIARMDDLEDDSESWSPIASAVPPAREWRPRRSSVNRMFMDVDRHAAVLRRGLQRRAEESTDTSLLRTVWRLSALCDSPLEDLLLLQMAVRFQALRACRVQFCEHLGPPRSNLIQIVPQALLGPYRADFLIRRGRDAGLVVECDGAEYHGASPRDQSRDSYMTQTFGVSILRVPGRAILGSSVGVELVVKVVAAQCGFTAATGTAWTPKPGLISVDWEKRLKDGMPVGAWTKLYAFGPMGGDG